MLKLLSLLHKQLKCVGKQWYTRSKRCKGLKWCDTLNRQPVDLSASHRPGTDNSVKQFILHAEVDDCFQYMNFDLRYKIKTHCPNLSLIN